MTVWRCRAGSDTEVPALRHRHLCGGSRAVGTAILLQVTAAQCRRARWQQSASLVTAAAHGLSDKPGSVTSPQGREAWRTVVQTDSCGSSGARRCQLLLLLQTAGQRGIICCTSSPRRAPQHGAWQLQIPSATALMCMAAPGHMHFMRQSTGFPGAQTERSVSRKLQRICGQRWVLWLHQVQSLEAKPWHGITVWLTDSPAWLVSCARPHAKQCCVQGH